jgi:transposase
MHTDQVRNREIVEHRLSGKSYSEIGKLYGLDQSTICRTLQKDEIREILETGMQQQIAMVPKAINVLHATLDQTEDKGLRLKAADTILKNTGLSPNTSTSITLTQILNVNTNVVPDAVQKFLEQIRKSDTPPAIGMSETVDVDVIDV